MSAVDATPHLKRPIFVIGVNKSGTSVLYLMLSRHSALSAIRAYRDPKPSDIPVAELGHRAMLYMENYGIGEGQRIPGLLAKLAPSAGIGHFATVDVVRSFRLTEADVEAGDAAAVAAAYTSGMVDGRKRLCEKSPPNMIRARYLQALFPDATFVAITRDPFATTAANGKKRTKWGDVAVQAEHWAEAHRLFLVDRPHLQRCMTITYEELIDDASGTLERVCAFCGIGFEPSMVDAVDLDPKVNMHMAALLDDQERALIQERCGPLWAEMRRLPALTRG